MRRFIPSALALAASLTLVGCGTPDEIPDPDAGTNQNALACGDTHDSVTTQKLYDDLVSLKCASCHYDGYPGTTLVLTLVGDLQGTVGAASTYKNDLKIVEANRPENSTFYLKSIGGSSAGIKGPGGHNVGARMPEGGTLSAAEQKMIKDWICSGAQ